MKTVASLLLLLGALILGPDVRAAVVNVYTSATFPPLMLGDGRGIYPDLIAHLNEHKPGGHTYRLSYLPRKRLQVKLEEGSLDGIVIGMMPEWLSDSSRTKYLWTEAFSADRFALVSRSSRPANPLDRHTLAGATVGVTTGYVYPGLDDWFAKSGLLRKAGVSDEKNIEKLLLGRVDCVIVAESMARYFIRTHQLKARLRMHPMPGPGTERRFLVQHRDAAVYEALAAAVQALRHDPRWQHTVASYQ
jgi:polar amino acid transport system substrate-binding protein